MIRDLYHITQNDEFKRYEFDAKDGRSVGYTVAYDNVESEDEACLAVYLALKEKRQRDEVYEKLKGLSFTAIEMEPIDDEEH